MTGILLLSLALTIGQAPAVGTGEAPEPRALIERATVAPERWWLMQELQGTGYGYLLDESRLDISGWTQVSFTGSTASEPTPVLGTNYLPNQFMMQQNWLHVHRKVLSGLNDSGQPDGTATEPSWGGVMDWFLPGTDYQMNLSKGLFTGQLTANNGKPNTYGVDVIQFYAEGFLPNVARGLDVKVGRFFSLYGVENINSPSNQLFSHAYSYNVNPSTHTGVLALTISEVWSAQAALVMGSDVFFTSAARPTFTGSVQWTRPGKKLDSAVLAVILGPGRFDVANDVANPQLIDFIYTRPLSERLTWTLEGQYGWQSGIPDIGFANWAGATHYFTQQLAPRLWTTLRMELFDDPQGDRTTFPGLYEEVTAGLNFRPRPGLVIRPELRWDHNGESRPYADEHSLFTAACDVIVRW